MDSLDRDKNMWKILTSSIPYRLHAVINVGGRQITKADYRELEAEAKEWSNQSIDTLN